MNAAGVVSAIKKYGLIVGPLFKPGAVAKCKKQEIIGWSVYRQWSDAGDDIFSSEGYGRELAADQFLSKAIHEAVKRIKSERREKQSKKKATFDESKEKP